MDLKQKDVSSQILLSMTILLCVELDMLEDARTLQAVDQSSRPKACSIVEVTKTCFDALHDYFQPLSTKRGDEAISACAATALGTSHHWSQPKKVASKQLSLVAMPRDSADGLFPGSLPNASRVVCAASLSVEPVRLAVPHVKSTMVYHYTLGMLPANVNC